MSRILRIFLILALVLIVGVSTAFAGIWGDSVDPLDYTGSRISDAGITDTYQKDFYVNWAISYNETSNFWNYSYTFGNNSTINSVILELFDGSISINNLMINETTASTYEGPMIYTSLDGDTTLNDLYGIKLPGGTNPITYSFETEVAPVWGNFYNIDNSGNKYAYSNALGITNFESNDTEDFIAAPGVVPEPISSILFITGGVALTVRRFWKSRKSS